MNETGKLSECSTDKDILREKATIFENIFLTNDRGFSIEFLNTEIGILDTQDYTEKDYLKDYIEFYGGIISAIGVTYTTEDLVKVNLGENEYVKLTMNSTFEGQESSEYFYVRKIDENLMCIINAYGGAAEKID